MRKQEYYHKSIKQEFSEIQKHVEALKQLIAEKDDLSMGKCPFCHKLAIEDVYMALEGSCKDCYSRLADKKEPLAKEMN